MPEHAEAEYSENDVNLPFNVGERRRHEVRKGEVEDPVGRCGEGDGLSTNAEWIEFGRVDPGDRTPGGRIRSDEEVGAGNDGLRRCASDRHRLGGRAELLEIWCYRVVAEKGGVHDEPGHHQEGTNKHGRTATPSVDPEKGWDGHDNIDDELNGRWE